jgi:hypothetical protein
MSAELSEKDLKAIGTGIVRPETVISSFSENE